MTRTLIFFMTDTQTLWNLTIYPIYTAVFIGYNSFLRKKNRPGNARWQSDGSRGQGSRLGDSATVMRRGYCGG
jgi:hypothetical protein